MNKISSGSFACRDKTSIIQKDFPLYSETDFKFRFPKIITPSKWKFTGSEGASGSVNLPEVEVGVGFSTGSIYIKHDEQSREQRLSLVGVGGVAGFGAIPCPISYSFSERHHWSTGRIFKLFAAGYDLSLDEIRGPCLFGDISGDLVKGQSAMAMYCGFSTSIPFSPINLPIILATSKAYFVIAGEHRSVIPGNIGVGAYFGMLV